MRILEELKLEWCETEMDAFREMWANQVEIPVIAQTLGCTPSEVALLIIDQAEKEIIGKWGEQMTATIETVNIYGETVRGKIIKENTNTVIVEGADGRQHVVRNERIGKKIAKRDKKHAEGFDCKKVEAYGHAPDKRAIHHNGRGQKTVRGEK